MSAPKKPAPKPATMPPIGRDAKSGQFRTVEFARNHPSTAVVERNRKPK